MSDYPTSHNEGESRLSAETEETLQRIQALIKEYQNKSPDEQAEIIKNIPLEVLEILEPLLGIETLETLDKPGNIL